MKKSEDDGYLVGKCLISVPGMADDRFANTLVYICAHSAQGAMGFVINKKIKEFSFTDLAVQLPITHFENLQSIDLHQGGPLEKVRGFVLHSTDYIKEDTLVIDEHVAISSSIDILTDIAAGIGPKENLIALGYASWAPQQLEEEILHNFWMITGSSPELVFRTKDEEKWEKALEELGVDINRLSAISGHA